MKNKKQPVIRVAIAERDQAIREAVCEKISNTVDFEIVIEADNGEELITRLKLKKNVALPDICVINVTMHGNKDGFETLKEIKDTWPEMRVLIFTAIENEHTVVDMVRNGADGYLLKKAHFAELITALRMIFETGNYDSDIATKSLIHAAKKYGDRLPEINERESEFLSLLAKGHSYKEIAKIMYKSPALWKIITIRWQRN